MNLTSISHMHVQSSRLNALLPKQQHACWINATALNCALESSVSPTVRAISTVVVMKLQSETIVKMALQGVWQLKKLIVSYCDWGVSSQV
ncbi:hypothetical protein V6N13_113143 [Hibiscus sabdariffa]